MKLRRLQVLLADSGLNKPGMVLRSLCAEAGCTLEVKYAWRRANLGHLMTNHCPNLAFVELFLLQSAALKQLRSLLLFNPAVPLILFADSADRECAVNCLFRGATVSLPGKYGLMRHSSEASRVQGVKPSPRRSFQGLLR